MHEPNMSVGMSSLVSPLVSPNQPTHCSSMSAGYMLLDCTDLIILHLNHT